MAYIRKPVSASFESPELQRAMAKVDEELTKLGHVLVTGRTRYIYISDVLLADSVGQDGDVLLVYGA